MIIIFNRALNVLITFIIFLVCFLGFWANKQRHKARYDNQGLEMVWTVLPAVILVVLGFNSNKLLYILEGEVVGVVFRVVAAQWYWVIDNQSLYMMKNLNFSKASSDIFLAAKKRIWIVTSLDVLHCFYVPDFFNKVDAVPGRINIMRSQTNEGVHYGLCAEICGANHAFMPIGINVV